MELKQRAYFVPEKDEVAGRIMDTDSEYKLLEAFASLLALQSKAPASRSGALVMFTEYAPCDSCRSVVRQFERMFPKIRVSAAFLIAYPKATSHR